MSKANEIIEKAKKAVLEYDQEAAEEVAGEALKAGISPVDVIQLGFTKAMTEVGDKYAAKELYLPHVIAASEAMTAGVKVLTPALEKMGGDKTKGLGTVVICTIEGDIHCIGKDIVGIMMKVAGFNVVNLGRDIPVKDIVAAVKQHNPLAVGTSALMTSTMVNQIAVEEMLKEQGIRKGVKTMVGGAPCTQQWADKIGADIYAENAGDAVNRLKAVVEHK
jgi:trimethylamine corrinoid protein